ncbi:popeye domain-containing protein 3-like isoform X1 [Branchiostoma floridae x Branchiostoma belcheri]
MAETNDTGPVGIYTINESGLCDTYLPQSLNGVFQLAHVFFGLAYFGGSTLHGLLYTYICMFLGYLVFTVYGFQNACAADIGGWCFVFMILCLVQAIHSIWRMREVSFSEELTKVYEALFHPLQVPLLVYKALVECPNCQIVSLEQGNNYATEGKTPVDRLSLMISGKAVVIHDGKKLHMIGRNQFLDSPEWEAAKDQEDPGKFQVTIRAETDCVYLTWPRRDLLNLLSRRRYLARVLSAVLGRDLTNKLYILNEKVMTPRGTKYDIRLPGFSRLLGQFDLDAKGLASFVPHRFGAGPEGDRGTTGSPYAPVRPK